MDSLGPHFATRARIAAAQPRWSDRASGKPVSVGVCLATAKSACVSCCGEAPSPSTAARLGWVCSKLSRPTTVHSASPASVNCGRIATRFHPTLHYHGGNGTGMLTLPRLACDAGSLNVAGCVNSCQRGSGSHAATKYGRSLGEDSRERAIICNRHQRGWLPYPSDGHARHTRFPDRQAQRRREYRSDQQEVRGRPCGPV